MESRVVVQAFGALAQETRLGIYRLLVTAGPEGMAAGAIAGELDLPPATLSFHLKELSQAGLARSRQQGRFVIYAANFDTMNGLVSFLTENCCSGAVCAAECAPAPAIRRRKAS
jgi:ArsR family transcriptional regulator, arsenate/arsenite/antimonite-responsive transcriptional repressor